MAILLRVLGFVSPYLLIAALVWLGWLGVQNATLHRENATLSADLAEANRKLGASEITIAHLGESLSRQNAATQALHDEGEARRSATDSRLRAFPDAGLPQGWSAPLTGATACERAEEVRDRLMEMLR